MLPRRSKYPNSRVLGPKLHTLNGFGSLKPYYLGTWTLWADPKLTRNRGAVTPEAAIHNPGPKARAL